MTGGVVGVVVGADAVGMEDTDTVAGAVVANF